MEGGVFLYVDNLPLIFSFPTEYYTALLLHSKDPTTTNANKQKKSGTLEESL